MSAPVATLGGVGHAYRGTKALDDVTLSIPAGGVTGLIGPDGVGKSTLLGLVAGVRRIQSGSVTVLGGDMANRAERGTRKHEIAYMPQGLGRNLYPTLTVGEHIAFFARLYGRSPAASADRIAELLAATGLAPFEHRAAGKLSGGMKQKLALCGALIHDPRLIVLDEPTTGVDPLSRRQFWELLARMRSRDPRISVLVATAYMSEAEGFDHIVALYGGRALAEGTPDEVKAQTGTGDLDAAFLALLPEETAGAHAPLMRPSHRPHEGPPAIEARGLTKRFGDFTAVDDVSFTIRPGEIFGFIGSNGCGKTTTMKMLTGLLPASEGTARLFGKPLDATDAATRRRVGYMSQSFSLYGELSVRHNLMLHARLFDLSGSAARARVAELLTRFDLKAIADRLPEELPLGQRQRLQLAVAVLHAPELLILDEPTSGVDPVARDDVWRLIIELSRNDGVTIFITTHFMNEAERCDRIALMHAGKVLAEGTPDMLREAQDAENLESAFIAYLEAADDTLAIEPQSSPATAARPPAPRDARAFDPARLIAFARREALELVRDPIRLTFAILGPIIMMLAMSYGISFDVDNLTFAALDRDRSRESREFLQELSASRYFEERAPLLTEQEVDARMATGEIGLAVIVPPGYGRDLLSGRAPEIAMWLDGSNPVRAETARSYVEGVHHTYLATVLTEEGWSLPPPLVLLEARFRYNQAFQSLEAIPPGALMMLLIMVPSMLTAVGIVREKELGSIANFYASPAGRLEYLVGKQLPYIVLAMASFATLAVMMQLLFGNTIKGSAAALVIGALAFVTAATAFGLVISSFVRSQIAAVFASAIIVIIPTLNFSGMIYPTATLEGAGKIMGQLFPALYFQNITSGVYNKGLFLQALAWDIIMIAAFVVGYWILAALLLRKQET